MARNEWDAAGDAAQMDRPNAARQEALQKNQQSLRAMAESLQLARETATTISMQSEQLGRTERSVDEAKYAVDVSKRIMKGMTWSGWITNAFTSAPQLESDAIARGPGGSSSSDQQITMGFICPECKVMFKNPEELAMHYSKSHEAVNSRQDTIDSHGSGHDASRRGVGASSRQQASQELTEDVNEQFLRDLEPQLAELKQASMALGNALDTQNQQLDRLGDKVDTVHDGMKRVSVQAKKLTGGRMPLVFRFRCAFQEVETRRFLRNVNGEAVLGADILVEGCTFRAYTLGDDTEMWGFQNDSSSFFLGLNKFGNLKIRGNDLQSYEQFAIEPTKPTTTLFAFASYFGYGGWIVRKDDDKLSIVRGSPENKATAARFKIIDLDRVQSELTERT